MRDSDEFDRFYTESVRRVSSFIYALTGDRCEAEDVAQEAYSRAWQHWERLSTYGDPEAWVRVVAYRVQVSRWRRVTTGFKAHRRHGPAPDVPELSVDYVAIVSALKEIPAVQRRAIVLYYLVGLSIDEIAEETGVAAGTVKSQLFRARNRLADLLTEKEPEAEAGGGTGAGARAGAGAGTGARGAAFPDRAPFSDKTQLFAKEVSNRA